MLVMEPAAIIPMANRKRCSAVTHAESRTILVALATPKRKPNGVTIIGGGAAIATFAVSVISW